MQTVLNPYLHFKTDARQAMEFYKSVFGGKLTVSTFKEYNASSDPSEDNNIMHAMLVTDSGINLMGADTPSHMQYNPGSTVTVSLSGDNLSELKTYFEKLSAGGQVTVPFETAPWGDTFGMFTDKFGIEWMVNSAGPHA